jgi:hypothetical protein
VTIRITEFNSGPALAPVIRTVSVQCQHADEGCALSMAVEAARDRCRLKRHEPLPADPCRPMMATPAKVPQH